MSLQRKGWFLLVAHVLLVGSIALKYAWERHTCPRVWTRATQFDPYRPLRGRYLALTLHADACDLSHAEQKRGPYARGPYTADTGYWQVHPRARDGHLVGEQAGDGDGQTEHLSLNRGLPCEYASLSTPAEFFIAEHAQTPFPLAQGKELWAEVTVPPSGPPRPMRLAVSDGKDFRVLDLR